MKKLALFALLAGVPIVASAGEAYDDANDSVYVVGQEYIQVGTPPGDQTAATNGLNGGTGWGRWQRGGYGTPPDNGYTYITNIPASFGMGAKQFGLHAGPLGVEGADARRRLNDDMTVNQKMTFSIMPGGAGAGAENIQGYFGAELRSSLLGNPGRDLMSISGTPGSTWSVYDSTGDHFTSIPCSPGVRIDVEITQLGLFTYSCKLTPAAGSPETVTGTFIYTGNNIRTVQFYAFITDGDFYANFLRVSDPARPVTGTVNLSDFDGPVAGRTATIEIRAVGSTTPIQTAVVTLGAGGSYSFNAASAVTPGNYSVAAKSSHWLRKTVASVGLSAAGATGVNFTLENGDIDDDNEVGIGDYAVLSGSYNTGPGDPNWDPNADLNGDDSVDIGDYSILSANYGDVGDE